MRISPAITARVSGGMGRGLEAAALIREENLPFSGQINNTLGQILIQITEESAAFSPLEVNPRAFVPGFLKL